MDTSTVQQSEDVSLIVHGDDTESDSEASETNDVETNTMLNEEPDGKIEEKAKNETEQTKKKKGRARPKREQSNIDKPPGQHRWNLRITGLVSNTCLDELKRLCGQYGTVLGGRILSKKRKTGIQYRACIGMSQPEEAEKCIQFLNLTKLNGHKIRVQKKRWRQNSLWRKLELSQRQNEALRLFQLGEQLRWEKMKMENQSLSKYEIGRQLLELNFRWTEVLRLNEMRNAMERPSNQRSAYKQKPLDGPMGSQMRSSHIPSIFQLPYPNQSRLGEMTHSMQKFQDRSNPGGSTQSRRKRNRQSNNQIPSLFELPFQNQPWLQDTVGFLHKLQTRSNPRNKAPWGGPMGPMMNNFPMLSIFELLFKNQSRVNPNPKSTDYGKQVQRNEGKDGRVLEGGSQSDTPKERQMNKKPNLFSDVQEKVERQIDDKLKRLTELVQSMQRPLNQRNEPQRPNMSNYGNTSRFDVPFQNESWPEGTTYSMQRPREEERWNDPKRSRVSSYNSNTSRYGPTFQNESCYNEYENTNYGRWGNRKERETTSWEMNSPQDYQRRNERRNDDWSRTNENWNNYDARRDMGQSGEPERRYINPDQERDCDSQNISSSNRMGQISSLGSGSNQRNWDSSSADRKGDNWSHMHGDVDNSGMNQRNDQWYGNPVNSTGRDATGAFVDSSRSTNTEGMGYNQRSTNMYDNSQSQDGMMMNTHGGSNFGGNNMSGQMQQPYFNTYNTGYQNEGFPSNRVGSQNRFN